MSRLRGLGVTDLFLRGPDGTGALKTKVMQAGFAGCHAWWAVDSLSAEQYAMRAISDIDRWKPGAGDLNIELSADPPLLGYIQVVVERIRAVKPNYNLRINVAPRKGFALPVSRLLRDSHLYACEQNYFGNMDQRFSEAEALEDMLRFGVPLAKASICYGAACKVGGVTGSQRVRILPNLPIRGISRGVIFTDDLLAEAGLI